MVLKIKDNDGKIMSYRSTPSGSVLIKGKRQLYLLHKSVNQSNKAKDIIAKNSFNKLFNKGKKYQLLGSKTSYLKIT